MLVRTALAIALTVFTPHSIARAECFIHTAKYVMAEPDIELVFGGRAVDVTSSGEWGTRVTFEVDRVWKGVVPERFQLYVWNRSAEHPRFQQGERYVVEATAVTDAAKRAELGVSASKERVYMSVQCSDRRMQSPTMEQDLGTGYEPKRVK